MILFSEKLIEERGGHCTYLEFLKIPINLLIRLQIIFPPTKKVKISSCDYLKIKNEREKMMHSFMSFKLIFKVKKKTSKSDLDRQFYYSCNMNI